MNCEKAREILEALIRGTLSGEEAREVRCHLATCADCASRLSPAAWIEVLPALDEGIEPSEDFAARLRVKIEERRHHQNLSDRQNASWWRGIAAWGWPWRLVAAGALAVLIAAGIFLGRHSGVAPDQAEYLNDIAVAEKLLLLQDMAVISNLDMLEDFDAIENLTPGLEGSKTPRSNP
jgi:anti-sigma factor RsiW